MKANKKFRNQKREKSSYQGKWSIEKEKKEGKGEGNY